MQNGVFTSKIGMILDKLSEAKVNNQYEFEFIISENDELTDDEILKLNELGYNIDSDENWSENSIYYNITWND